MVTRTRANGANPVVFEFATADPSSTSLLGGKGAGLAAMFQAGLQVPAGFIVTTDGCREYQASGSLTSATMDSVFIHLGQLEERTGKTFGGGQRPLLVSVRSGAPVSMPGMMDTVLNLGVTEEAAVALAERTGSVAFMADIVTRFHKLFSEIVLGGDGDAIALAAEPIRVGVSEGDDARRVYQRLSEILRAAEHDDVGAVVPEDSHSQLERAITAVFESWNSRRAVMYRSHHGISDLLGTAVVVQEMVFGNLGHPSGTGVAFTRDPRTGEPVLYGEFLEGGQGEDLVSGVQTPIPIADVGDDFAQCFSEFADVARRLENTYNDVLDVEFTIEEGRLYLLQVRSAKRTAAASVRIAADFIREGVMSGFEALRHVTPEQVRQLERPSFEPEAVRIARASGEVLATGVGASPGQVSGVVVTDPDRAAELASDVDVILLRQTTSPLDLRGMLVARGIVTALGGATSHAAVVARAVGTACVTGCGEMTVDAAKGRVSFGSTELMEGAEISVDGASGEVFRGVLPCRSGADSAPDLAPLLDMARSSARCRTYAVVATSEQVSRARRAGADGLAVRMSELLTAAGRMNEVIDVVSSQSPERLDLTPVGGIIADLMKCILVAAGDMPVVVRAIDVTHDPDDTVDVDALLAKHPALALPLGVPEMLRVQLAGLRDALSRAERSCGVDLVVRDVSDTHEIAAIRGLRDTMGAGARIRVGPYVTSPRAGLRIPGLAEEADCVWLDPRRLMIGASGYGSTAFLNSGPLDEYVRRGFLETDPRAGMDPAHMGVLSSAMQARITTPGCAIGARLAEPVSEELIAAYFRAGVRMFAVDPSELHATQIGLGKTALADDHFAFVSGS